MSRFWQVALADAVILVSLAVTYITAARLSGDTSTALGLVFMVGFIFISTPLLALTIAVGISHIQRVSLSRAKWVLFYVCLSITGHLVLAFYTGFFDKWIADYKREARERQFPALTQLQYAIARGPVSDIETVRKALAQGADPNGGSYSDARIPLLVLAAGRADAPAIKALLDAGADPNARSPLTHGDLATPAPLDLVLFSAHGSPKQSMELLLAAGADASQSMLKLGACFTGDALLYQQAASLGAQDQSDVHDNNCLHHAAAENRTELLEELIPDTSEISSDFRNMLAAPNHNGQYPLDVAAAKQNFHAALRIAQAGGTANKTWTMQRILQNPQNTPELAQLKALLAQRASADEP
jgi:ankyrin repeat protein